MSSTDVQSASAGQEPKCPNNAIYEGSEIYIINSQRCTECVGHFYAPQCVEVCPVDCILVDVENIETEQQLQKKYLSLIK